MSDIAKQAKDFLLNKKPIDAITYGDYTLHIFIRPGSNIRKTKKFFNQIYKYIIDFAGSTVSKKLHLLNFPDSENDFLVMHLEFKLGSDRNAAVARFKDWRALAFRE